MVDTVREDVEQHGCVEMRTGDKIVVGTYLAESRLPLLVVSDREGKHGGVVGTVEWSGYGEVSLLLDAPGKEGAASAATVAEGLRAALRDGEQPVQIFVGAVRGLRIGDVVVLTPAEVTQPRPEPEVVAILDDLERAA
jgi:hypothetical protein